MGNSKNIHINRRRWFVVGAGALLFVQMVSISAGAWAQQVTPVPPTTAPANSATPTVAMVPVPSTYIVTRNDVLDISVLGETELTKSVTVLPDGTINYPYVGNLVVAGLSVKEVQKRITAKIARQIVDPEVLVSVSKRQDFTASVIGAVRSPGKYAVQKEARVLDLLTESGGLTSLRPEWATAMLVHSGTGASVPIDLIRLLTLADPKDNVPVGPGDILIVREVDQAQTQIQVLGEVNRPGVMPIPSDGSIAAALAAAGGPTARAALTKATILRGEKTIPVNLQSLMNEGKPLVGVALQPGDTLVVRPNQESFAVMGAVNTPGTVVYPENQGLDIVSALSRAGGQTGNADLKKAVLFRPAPDGGTAVATPIDLSALNKGDLSQNISVKPGDVLFIPDKGDRKPGNSLLPFIPALALALRYL